MRHRPILTAFFAALLATSPAFARPLKIGGFNLTRGGLESFANTTAPDMAGLKAAILKAYPHSTFKLTGKLTPAYLKSVHLVLIGVTAGPTTPITLLTKAEQTALLNFVKSGGTALLFCDNSIQFNPASNSLISPFGLVSDGIASGSQTASFTTASPDPVETGPSGAAKQLTATDTAWFTTLGKATALATLDSNAQPFVAYIAPGTLAAGSGAVLAWGDSSLLLDALRTPDDQTAILNALALSK